MKWIDSRIVFEIDSESCCESGIRQISSLQFSSCSKRFRTAQRKALQALDYDVYPRAGPVHNESRFLAGATTQPDRTHGPISTFPVSRTQIGVERPQRIIRVKELVGKPDEPGPDLSIAVLETV